MSEYPTIHDLDRIAFWPHDDLRECFRFIRSIWWASDWGWHEASATEAFGDRPVQRYEISTGGWSGNEDIVAAMERNHMLMALTWQQSRRGGHYIFELPDALIRTVEA